MVTLSNPNQPKPRISFRGILLQATIRVLFVAILVMSANVALTIPGVRAQIELLVDQAAAKLSNSSITEKQAEIDPSKPQDRVPVRRAAN